MKKLQKKLSEWRNRKLITPNQQQKILDYEQSKTRSNKSKWVFYGFLILGISVVGIGVISLIAANWEKTPPSLKLAGNFLFLSCIAAVVIKTEQKKNYALFDAASSLFSLLCLASIGLISQIFHTGVELYQALLIWLIIIFPLSTFSKRDFLLHLWIAGFITMFLLWAFSKSSWWYYLENNTDDNIFTVFLLLPLLCLFLSIAVKKIQLLARFGKIFNLWVFVSSVSAVAASDIYLSVEDFSFHPGAFVPVYIFALLSIALLYIWSDFSIKERVIITIMVLFTLVYFIPSYISSGSSIKDIGKITGAFYSIVMLIMISIFFTIRNNKRIFNAITLLIGIRFLIIYFQVLGDLATTGLGLIASGILIIAVSMLWYKKREKIGQWLGDLLR